MVHHTEVIDFDCGGASVTNPENKSEASLGLTSPASAGPVTQAGHE